MDVEQIRAARLAHPLGRFTLELDDGRLLPVEEPYYVGLSPGGKQLIYADPAGGFLHLSTSQVVRIHPRILTARN